MRALVCLTLAAGLLACEEELGPGPATPIILTSPPVHAPPPVDKPLTREPVLKAALVPETALKAEEPAAPVAAPEARPPPPPVKKKKKTTKR